MEKSAKKKYPKKSIKSTPKKTVKNRIQTFIQKLTNISKRNLLISKMKQNSLANFHKLSSTNKNNLNYLCKILKTSPANINIKFEKNNNDKFELSFTVLFKGKNLFFKQKGTREKLSEQLENAIMAADAIVFFAKKRASQFNKNTQNHLGYPLDQKIDLTNVKLKYKAHFEGQTFPITLAVYRFTPNGDTSLYIKAENINSHCSDSRDIFYRLENYGKWLRMKKNIQALPKPIKDRITDLASDYGFCYPDLIGGNEISKNLYSMEMMFNILGKEFRFNATAAKKKQLLNSLEKAYLFAASVQQIIKNKNVENFDHKYVFRFIDKKPHSLTDKDTFDLKLVDLKTNKENIVRLKFIDYDATDDKCDVRIIRINGEDINPNKNKVTDFEKLGISIINLM